MLVWSDRLRSRSSQLGGTQWFRRQVTRRQSYSELCRMLLHKEPGHRATHLHQPEPPHRSNHFKLDRIAALRWRLERGYHGVPDEPGPLSAHPLHVDILRPGHLG